jgi:hypothetical protein
MLAINKSAENSLRDDPRWEKITRRGAEKSQQEHMIERSR